MTFDIRPKLMWSCQPHIISDVPPCGSLNSLTRWQNTSNKCRNCASLFKFRIDFVSQFDSNFDVCALMHFAPSISFDNFIFFLGSCFELENKQGFGSVILDNYIVPICSKHFFLLDERGSNSQHPTNLWGNYGAGFLGLRSIGFMILGASTDSTPVSPLSSFPIHSYSYSHVSWKGKGHKGSADGPMLLMSPSNLRNSGIADPEVRRKKLNAELANGRLAMFAIIGMFFQEPWICMEIFGGFLKMGVPPNHPKLDYLLKPMVLGIPYLKKKHFK